MDRYIEIFLRGEEYDIQIRWCGSGEQSETYGVKTLDEVNEIVKNFFKTGEQNE